MEDIDAVLAQINGIEASAAVIDNDAGALEDIDIDAALAAVAEIDVETADDVANAVIEIEDAAAEVEPQPEDIDAALKALEPVEQPPVEIVAEAPAEVEPVEAEAEPEAAPAEAPATKPAPAPARRFTDVAAIDDVTLKANLDGCKAVKVTEKAMNVIAAIESGKKLSRYTKDAVKKLQADGRVSGKSLVEEFIAKQLSDGTARAQAQQMTALFKMLGIAMPDPTNSRELVVNDADLLKELVALAA